MSNSFQPQGMSCPECSTRISVNIIELLSQGKVVCPNCHLELIVDQAKSQESMAILGRVYEQINSAEKQFKDTVSHITEQPKRVSRARSRRRNSRHSD